MIARVLRVAGRREDKACVVQRSLVGRGHERAGSTRCPALRSQNRPRPRPIAQLTHERPVPCV